MTTRAPDTTRMVQLFHALSDPTRLSIVQRLRFGERCVCDLTDALDAAQSRLSFHLKVLKDAGIEHLVVDQNMSVMEGSLGVLPRRILVVEEDIAEARQLLTDAGVGGELRPEGA